MKRRKAIVPSPSLDAQTTAVLPDGQQPTAKPTDKKWQIDRPGGVPAPVIRANMISLRQTYQGRVKVAFFEQD